MIRILFTFAVLLAGAAHAEQTQVTQSSDKPEYSQGEAISLSYEALWLCKNPGNIRVSHTAFPELEVLYVNWFLVEMIVTGTADQLREPSRHERATFAPTMSRASDLHVINDEASPATFLNGKRGYHSFDRAGAYVI
jgi:hypothetical protein